MAAGQADLLTITSGATDLELAPREVAEPDPPWSAPTWVLDTLVDGEVASSSLPADAPEATLVFARQPGHGRNVQQSAAEYTIEGDPIRVHPWRDDTDGVRT